MRTHVSRRAAVLMAAVVAGNWGGIASATTDTYSSATGASLWSTVANWSEGHTPNAGEDSTISFSDSMVRTVTLDVSTNALNSVFLDETGTGSFTFLQNTALNVTATTTTVGFLGTVTYNQTNGNLTTTFLNIGAGTGAPSKFNLTSLGKVILNASGSLRVGDLAPGNFTQNGASTTVTVGTGSAGIAIGIQGGAGSYLLEAGNITNTGSGGSLVVGYSDHGDFDQTGGSVALPGGSITVGNFAGATGTYELSSSGQAITASLLVVGAGGNGTFSQSFGNSTISSTMTLGQSAGGSGNYSLTGGQLTTSTVVIGQAGTGDFVLNGGAQTVPNALTLGSGSLSVGTYELISGNLTAATENIGVLGAAIFTQTGGNDTIEASGQLNIGTGTANAFYNLSGGNLSLQTLSVLNNSGDLNMAGGSITGAGSVNNASTIMGFGSIAVNGTFTNTGTIIQQGGILTIGNFTGNYTNAGTINLSLPGQLTIGAIFTNNGSMNLNGGRLAGSGQVTNAGLMIGPGTIALSFNNAAGGLLVAPSGFTTLSGLTNTGIIELTSVTSLLNTGGLLANSGTVQGIGSLTGTGITNVGTIEAVGGTLVVAGTLFNNSSGTLRASSGNKLVVTQGLATNAGLISLTGGTFDNNNNPLDNTGQITGYGTFASSVLTNDGSLTFTGTGGGGTTTINGDVINSAGRTINVKFNPAIFTGNITNSGTIKTTSTTVTFTGNYTGSTYISDPATNIFEGSATTIAGGSMTGSTGDVFNFAGGVFTNHGTFSNGGTLTVASGIVNNGTFVQTGPQTWSAGATFTNSGGSATFGSNAKLYGLTITAGTVDVTGSKVVVEASGATKAGILSSLQGYAAASSLLSTGQAANFGLAVLDNGVLNRTSFGGLAVDGNAVLLSAELLGDANADGQVDLTDLSTVLNNFGTATPNWTSGNFDNATAIDLTDLSAVLNNFGAVNAGAAGTLAAAPEPASLPVLGGAVFVLGRKRRRGLNGAV